MKGKIYEQSAECYPNLGLEQRLLMGWLMGQLGCGDILAEELVEDVELLQELLQLSLAATTYLDRINHKADSSDPR